VVLLSFTARPRRLVAVTGCSLGLVLALTGCGGGDDSKKPTGSAAGTPTASPRAPDLPSTSASPVPTPRVTAVAVPAAELVKAKTTTQGYLSAVSNLLATPKSSANKKTRAALTPGVVGAALVALDNQALELAQANEHLEGSPKVVSSVVTSRTTNPPAMTVSVCLDNADVRVVNKQGKKLPRDPNVPTRTRNILHLVQRNGTWVVADQSFPDNPNC
jgi:hypothetical protein